MKLQITMVEGYLHKSYSAFLSEEYFSKRMYSVTTDYEI